MKGGGDGARFLDGNSGMVGEKEILHSLCYTALKNLTKK